MGLLFSELVTFLALVRKTTLPGGLTSAPTWEDAEGESVEKRQ